MIIKNGAIMDTEIQYGKNKNQCHKRNPHLIPQLKIKRIYSEGKTILLVELISLIITKIALQRNKKSHTRKYQTKQINYKNGSRPDKEAIQLKSLLMSILKQQNISDQFLMLKFSNIFFQKMA